MNTRIKDITLLKFIGKGSFGTVYLSKKDGKPGYFATKQIERVMADKPGYYKYFENELRLLQDLHHPNIVHLEDVKKDDKYYYIVMEYVNGGSLTDCLKKYQLKYGKAFPEEIVQYLMRQIVDAIKFIHQRNIIHRDLKLDNIMVNFDNENDKNNLNMMRAKVKIIDFGFATKLTPAKNNLAQTALGSPINMDPLILNVMAKKRQGLKTIRLR
jgi:serine/threonine protein kinase